jgi:trans-L-3-hydroxyproline dehydratase
VSARLALEHARGLLPEGKTVEIESVIGSTFRGTVKGTQTYGPYPAVIPEVEGMAYLCGTNEFCVDPADPFRTGFFLR